MSDIPSAGTQTTVAEKIFAFVDERVGLKQLTAKMLNESVPGGSRWAYVFGSILLFIFGMQTITGGRAGLCTDVSSPGCQGRCRATASSPSGSSCWQIFSSSTGRTPSAEPPPHRSESRAFPRLSTKGLSLNQRLPNWLASRTAA